MAKQPKRTVTVATADDVKYVVHLADFWRNNIGFLPRSALEKYIKERRTLLVMENGQHAGYLNFNLTKKGVLRINQVAMAPDLLRTTLGTKLMRHLERAGKAGGASIIRLQSRTDLGANQFWPTLGLNPTAVVQRPTCRGLPLIEWTKQLLEPTKIIQSVLDDGKSMARTRLAIPQPFVDLTATPANKRRFIPPRTKLNRRGRFKNLAK